MARLSDAELEKIRKLVEDEFPDDPALQQVHRARKIIAREAELQGLSYLEYIKRLARESEQRGKPDDPESAGLSG